MRKEIGHIGGRRDSMNNYILVDEKMREEIFMKIEDVIDSDHHSLVVSLKESRNGKRGEGKEAKGACREVWEVGKYREMLGRME